MRMGTDGKMLESLNQNHEINFDLPFTPHLPLVNTPIKYPQLNSAQASSKSDTVPISVLSIR